MKNRKLISALLISSIILSMITGCGIKTSNRKIESNSSLVIETRDNASVNNDAIESSSAVSEKKGSSVPYSKSESGSDTLYITGSDTVNVYKDQNGSEINGTLKYGTAVTVVGDSGVTYSQVEVPEQKISGYVQNDHLVSERSSVTQGITATVGENGAKIYDKEGGNLIESLYPGTQITIIAKTSGGYWRVKTSSGNYGYINVTDIASDTVTDSQTQQTQTFENDEQSWGSQNENNNDFETDNTVSNLEAPSAPEIKNEPNDPDSFLGSALTTAQNKVGGNWAAFYIDLNSGNSSSMNSSPMQAASLIKLFIMGAVYEDYETYSAQEPNLDNWLYYMITVSDNASANNLVRMLGNGNTDVGRNAVTSYCYSHGYNSTSMGRLLLESNINGDNYTSVADCAYFLQSVYNGELPHSADMLSLLSQQTVTTKIPAGVPVRTANKTGELGSVQNDAAIVYADSPYVLCVMSENVPAGSATSAIVELSSTVYNSR